ncbi:hypothetical protein L3X38_029785 [Prunus dulcis]|uniref:Ribulose bisphosphate carboxylase large chain n=1 Tax=Prunus dulcis TaxID=3755 RepID=A0AAD4VU83_PRUDU|nr:hypothetical protein L3X38_029785 [Prunus dulcis]
MPRVRAFALAQMPAPPPYTMLILRYFGGFVVYEEAGAAVAAESSTGTWTTVWQLIPSTCRGDVVSGGGSGGSAEFCFGFVCYLSLGWGGQANSPEMKACKCMRVVRGLGIQLELALAFGSREGGTLSQLGMATGRIGAGYDNTIPVPALHPPPRPRTYPHLIGFGESPSPSPSGDYLPYPARIPNFFA